MRDVFLILCSFVIFSVVNCQYYIVKAPNVIRFNHAETVNVSVFGLVSAKAKVKIWLQHGDKIFSVREVLVKNKREPMTTSVRVKERDLSGVNVENGRPRSLWIFSEYEGTKKSREVAINYQSGYAPTDKRIFTAKEKVYRMFATKKLLKPSTRQHETMKIIKHELTVRNYLDGPNEHLEWNSDTRGIHKQNNRVPRATDCTANGVLENGSFIERNQTTNGIVRYYTCSEKHTSNIPGLETKRFKCNGSEWISSSKKGQVLPLSNVTCKAIQCMELSDPKNGIVMMEGVYVGDKAIFSCNEGFYWNGHEEITCMQTGQWSDANAKCKKKELGTTRCSYTNDTNHVIGMNLTCAEMFSTNSICVSDICTCPSGFVTNSEKTSCEQGQLGKTACMEDSKLVTGDYRTCAEVFSNGSTCVSNICTCSKGYIMNRRTSVCEKGQLGITTCADSSDLRTDETRTCAEVFSTGSICISGICKCSAGYVMNSGKSACEKGQLGINTCANDFNLLTDDSRTCAEVFSSGSTCASNVCKCSTGQLGNTTCGSNLVTGDTRTCEEVFSTGTTCASGICKCATGYVTNPGKSACIQGQLGITTCGSNLVSGDTRTCEEVFSTGTTCAPGMCKCATGYVTNPGKSACIQGQLGITTCGSNLVTGDIRTCEEVFSTGTTCASGICKCATGYVTNPGKLACIQGQLGNTTCGFNLVTGDTRTCEEVFSTGTTCASGICKCATGYVTNPGKSACIQGQLNITTCGSNLVTGDTRTCEEVFSTGTTCASGMCKCATGYVTNPGKSACIQGQLGNTTCGSNFVTGDTRTCEEVFSTGTTCASGICKCATGYVTNPGKSACIQGQLGIATCADGSNLLTDDNRTCLEVFLPGATCVSNLCKCSSKYVTNSGKSACVQGQLGITTCAVGSDLITHDTRMCAEVFSTGSTCMSGLCKCSAEYVMNYGKSACEQGKLGITPCAKDSNLVANDTRTCAEVFSMGSSCESNVCKCSTGYVANSGKSACIEGKLGITPCAKDSNLVANDTRTCAEVFSMGSSCESNVCKCSTGYVANSGKSACIEGKLGITPCAKDSNLVANDTRTCAEVFSMGSSCESNVCKCSTGYVANSGKSACIEVLQCREDKDYMGNYWNTSSPGREMNIACPEGFTGMVSRFCDGNGFYQPPVYNCTRTELKAIQTEVLQNTTFNVTSILARLATATADDGKANGTLLLGDVDSTNNILMKITEAIDDNYTKMFDLADLFLNVANNMLKENTTSTWKVKINKTGEGINTLLENVDRFIEKVVGVTNTSNISSTEFQKTNLYLKVGSTASCMNGFRFPDRNDTEIPEWAANTTDYVDVPCSINDTARAYSSVIYRNISNIIPSTTFSNYRAVPMKVDTPVISFTFLPSDNRKLDTPIQLNFRLFSESLVDPVCSFWTKGNSSGSGHWSSDGCWLENYNLIDGTVVCKCNHLTNFAVLTSPSSIALREHHRVLSIISMVGCIISMVALFITVTVHIVFWRKLKSEKTVINMCLCCTLFLAYLLFLTGIEQTDNKDVCKAFAVMLHFVYLAAFFIMLVEGVYLVNMAFIPTKKYKLSKPLLVASYVMAAVIVAVSGGSVQLDGYGTSAHCWLSTETGLIWAFVGPVLLIVLINIIIVAAVIWRMCRTKATSNKTYKEKTKSGLRNLLVLMPVMGVTWLFGVFSINGDTISFQYLFAIFNSLQGLLIFIFYCWTDRKVQDAFRTASSSRKLTQLISHSPESGSSTSPAKNTSNTDV